MTSDLLKAMNNAGILCKDPVVDDGQIHRFANGGKGDKDAWYVLYPHGGAFGDWSLGISERWSSLGRKLSSKQEQKILRKIRQEKSNKQLEYEDVASQVNDLILKLSLTGSSVYLDKKQLKSEDCGPICFGVSAIVIPFRDASGKVWTVQYIQDDGSKRFHAGGRKGGCFHLIGNLDDESNAIYVCEGLSTGASIYAAMQSPTVVAGDAYNLEPVIHNLRLQYPNKEIVICADNDQWKGVINTGITKATAAASKHRCKVIWPEFEDLTTDIKPTDFNDLHQLIGLDVVKEQILKAQPCERSLDDVVDDLVMLEPSVYQKQRKDYAKKLNLSLKELDATVKEQREKVIQNNGMVAFPEWDIEPWPQAVSAEEVLQDLVRIFDEFAIVPEYGSTALALWTIFTWCTDSFDVAPILALYSPEKRCGKTTVMSLLSELVSRPLSSSNTTPAAIFRSIEQWEPTLLIDEADTFLKNSEEMRGILNAGHTRKTGYVLRTVGDQHEPKRFNTWGAKAIALIGKLPDTLHDRSIVIGLKRKNGNQKCKRIKDVDVGFWSSIRSKLVRFADDHEDQLRKARPVRIDGLSDRAMDNWEPLLAIAALAGFEWLDKASQAAQALSGGDHDVATTGTQLLKDIWDIFNSTNEENISTKDLINKLCEDEEKPWFTYSNGKPITSRQLANLFNGYGIRSGSKRHGTVTFKGYSKDQFEDAWSRYLNLPALPAINVTASQPNQIDEKNVTDKTCVTSQTDTSVTGKTREIDTCDRVTDKKRGGR